MATNQVPNLAKVLIADDHALVREALQLRLAQLNMQIVGEAENGAEICHMAQSKTADLILMDISMPGVNGIEATRRIKAGNPDQAILILSTYDGADYVRAAAEAGADGYILKTADLDEMAKAIQIIKLGGTYFTGPVRDKVFDQSPDDGTPQPLASELTRRETEILGMIKAGHRSKEMAVQLNISIRTVEAHRRSLKQKLG